MDRLWLVADGTVKPFQGSLGDYRQLVLTGETKVTEENEFAPVVEATLSPQERRRRQAEARAVLAPLRKQIKQLEQQIDNAEKRVSKIDAQLSDSSIYESDPAKVTKLNKERADSVKAAETAEAQWLELSEQLEAAMTQSE